MEDGVQISCRMLEIEGLFYSTRCGIAVGSKRPASTTPGHSTSTQEQPFACQIYGQPRLNHGCTEIGGSGQPTGAMRYVWVHRQSRPQVAGTAGAPLCPIEGHGPMRHDLLGDDEHQPEP